MLAIIYKFYKVGYRIKRTLRKIYFLHIKVSLYDCRMSNLRLQNFRTHRKFYQNRLINVLKVI